MLNSGEAANTNFIVFGFNTMNYLTQGMNSNHYDSIDEYIRALWSLLVLQLKTIISRL
jgi:hypothetical protein